MAPDGPYEGYLHLWFSLYTPPDYENTTASPFSLSDEIEFWLIKEFLCGSEEIISIRLVQDTLLTSTCMDQSYFREDNLRKRRRRLALPSDTVVLWNSPTSEVTEDYLMQSEEDDEFQNPLQYTFWNISFPVFDWGSANKSPRLVQRDVQHLLEQKIWLKHLGVPIANSGVSVRGDEDDFWALRPPTMAPSIAPKPLEEAGATPLQLPRPAAIDPIEARNLRYIGVLLIVVQTILSMLLYQYGKNFRAIQQEKEELKKDKQSLDQMLQSSKGFVEIDRSLNTIEPSESLETRDSISTKQSKEGWYIARNASTVDTKNEHQTRDQTKPRRSSHREEKVESRKQKERNSISSIEKSRRSNSSQQNSHRRHSDGLMVDPKSRRSSHSSSSQQSPQRRQSHESGNKRRHSHQSRQKRHSGQSHDTVPLRTSERANSDIEVLWQQNSPAASVRSTGEAERRKHHHQHRHSSSKLRVIDDTQVL